MPSRPKPPVAENGFYTDPETGLAVPTSYTSTALARTLETESAINGLGFSKGFNIPRDPDTLAVHWPEKGSGWDDVVNQAVVDGTIANVGLSPVVAPQISGMVRRQQNQAMLASIDLAGRRTPVLQAREAISRFNDAPLGAMQALEKIVYGLCTYNRGAPIATVPFIYAPEQWDEYGLRAIPFSEKRAGRRRASKTMFYLEVDWARVGTPIPYLPNVFNLEATGNTQWPYWYRTKIDDTEAWVLLHESHILPITPGSTAKAGIGTSPVWMCLGILAEQILVQEERAEKLLYSMTDGVTLLGGVEGMSGDKIRDHLMAARKEAKARGFIAAKGQTILTSPTAQAVSAVTVSFRQPSGAEFKDWREFFEDVIAFSFGETLSALVVRGGVGYGSQADTASENTADMGVGAILSRVSLALGTIYKRVQISISRPNDRNQRLNIETLEKFSQAAAPLIDRGVLTAEDARNIIDRDILSLPTQALDTSVASPGTNESEEVNNGRRTAPATQRANTQTQPEPAG